MTYHILHQFDEQWFAESRRDTSTRPGGFFRDQKDQPRERNESRNQSAQSPWLIVILSLAIAACSLYFAIDAHRQTTNLQQRLSDLETRLMK